MTNGILTGADGRVARYGKLVARAGSGPEVARILLASTAAMADDPGCELYLVQHERERPDTLWVTEVWRSQTDLDRVTAGLADDPDVKAVMALLEDGGAVELTLLGGKWTAPAGD